MCQPSGQHGSCATVIGFNSRWLKDWKMVMSSCETGPGSSSTVWIGSEWLAAWSSKFISLYQLISAIKCSVQKVHWWLMNCKLAKYAKNSNSCIFRSVYQIYMKFDRQLRPATETWWVVSYGGKTVSVEKVHWWLMNYILTAGIILVWKQLLYRLAMLIEFD